MECAPHRKRPRRAVPEAADEHREHEVHVAPALAVPISAERDVEVVAQEPRERHVPAPPEFRDVCRLVGRGEIQRQHDAEHPREADRHVRVAGKIKVELERVCERAAPRIVRVQRRHGRAEIENPARRRTDAIRDDRLFEKPDGKNREAHGEVVPVEAVRLRLAELRHHLFVVDDRPRDEMREECDEQQEVAEVVFAHHAAAHIHEIRDLGEGKKRDAEREDDLPEAPVRAEDGVHISHEKIGVFEIAEEEQIRGDGECEPPHARSPRLHLRADAPAEREIHQHRGDDQQRVDWTPPAVEKERRERERRLRRLRPEVAREQAERAERDRQKKKQENVRTEEHVNAARG